VLISFDGTEKRRGIKNKKQEHWFFFEIAVQLSLLAFLFFSQRSTLSAFETLKGFSSFKKIKRAQTCRSIWAKNTILAFFEYFHKNPPINIYI
jgi:hypothetical protein